MDEFTWRMAKALEMARAHAGLSQEKLAKKMGVSRPSIAAWEQGTKSPTLPTALLWFTCCGVSAARYMDACIHPGLLERLEDGPDDAEKRRLLHEAIDEASSYEVDALLYIRYGDHGSDHLGVITEMLANLHCPLDYRVSHCGTIINDYEVVQGRGLDPDPYGTPTPKMPLLLQAFNSGKTACMDEQSAYTIMKEVMRDATKKDKA